MKNSLLLSLLFGLLLAACADHSKISEAAKSAKPAANPDSIGMADALHQFYKWYGENQQQLTGKMDFINKSGQHPTIDLSLLARYLSEYAKSGAVCTEFIQNETIFYRACSLAWAEEKSSGMLTGFEVDRYYCSEDGDAQEFLTAGVTYEMTGDRATTQLMLKPDGPNGGPRSFEMKKENGKWLLSKNLCDAAVLH